jgi:hypothetical protein
MVTLWMSKLEKHLAPSSSKAEYYGMSEAAKDVTFCHEDSRSEK